MLVGLCFVFLSVLAARGEAQGRADAAGQARPLKVTNPAWTLSKTSSTVQTALPYRKFPLIKKILKGKLSSLKLPSLKRAELDAKLTSALSKRHFGLRDLAAKATGALAGAGAVRSLRTGLLPLNLSHVLHLLADAKLACVAEHAALCFKGVAADERRIAASKASIANTTSNGEVLPEQAHSTLASTARSSASAIPIGGTSGPWTPWPWTPSLTLPSRRPRWTPAASRRSYQRRARTTHASAPAAATRWRRTARRSPSTPRSTAR